MDDPATPPAEFTRALDDIRWVNENLGGTETLLREVAAMVDRNDLKSLSVLDLGTGSADIPVAMVEWAQKRSLPMAVTALDLHSLAVDEAKKRTADLPEVTVVQGDALAPDFPDGAFDLVVSSMFMHHLSDEQAVQLLQQMARLSRVGLIVNDLERHPLAWLGIHSLGWLTGKGAVFRNDAPLSVLRGFTQGELERLREASGLSTMKLIRRSPYRWVLSWEKSD